MLGFDGNISTCRFKKRYTKYTIIDLFSLNIFLVAFDSYYFKSKYFLLFQNL